MSADKSYKDWHRDDLVARIRDLERRLADTQRNEWTGKPGDRTFDYSRARFRHVALKL